MGPPIVIVGAGGHAVSVAETTAAAGYDIVAFVGRPGGATHRFGIPVVGAIPPDHLASGGPLVVAEGDNAARERAVAALGLSVDPERFPPLVHPSASVSRFASLGPGTVVLQGAVVGSGATAGAFCVLNTASSTDHECELADFASVGPGAVLGGGVRVGVRTAVSIGAVVKHGVALGDDAVLGANAYAHRDIPDRVVAYGSPARVVRDRTPGEPYLG